MANNLDLRGIEFQIVGESEQAVKHLNNLSASLKALKTATSGGLGGLSKTTKEIASLKKALSGAGFLNSAKLSTLASALSKLSSVGSIKISSTIPKRINEISVAVSAIDTSKLSNIKDLVKALKPLGELGKTNLATYVNSLKKLPEVMQEIDSIDMTKLSTQMLNLADALKPFATQMQMVANGFAAFPSRIQRVIASTDRYNAAMSANRQTSDRLSSLFNFGAAIYGIYQVADAVGYAITKSNEYQENLNLFTVAMGEYAQEAYDYGQIVSETLGIDFSEWIRNQGVFNTLLTGFGNTADRAALMSKNLTQLGYDLSSFYNVSVEESMLKLQSAISGELEPIRRFGVDLSEARLKAEALALGIDKSVSSMTQAEKAELRYYAVMTQTIDKQGDLARTLNLGHQSEMAA